MSYFSTPKHVQRRATKGQSQTTTHGWGNTGCSAPRVASTLAGKEVAGT